MLNGGAQKERLQRHRFYEYRRFMIRPQAALSGQLRILHTDAR